MHKVFLFAALYVLGAVMCNKFLDVPAWILIFSPVALVYVMHRHRLQCESIDNAEKLEVDPADVMDLRRLSGS